MSRPAKRFPYKGEMLTAREIAEREGITPSAARARIAMHGTVDADHGHERMADNAATVDGVHMSLKSAAKLLGIGHAHAAMLARKGIDLAEALRAERAEAAYWDERKGKPLIDLRTSFESDGKARAAAQIARERGGLTTRVIGGLVGMSRQAVDRIVDDALRTLRRRANTPEMREALEWMAMKARADDEARTVWDEVAMVA